MLGRGTIHSFSDTKADIGVSMPHTKANAEDEHPDTLNDTPITAVWLC